MKAEAAHIVRRGQAQRLVLGDDQGQQGWPIRFDDGVAPDHIAVHRMVAGPVQD